jgi:Glycosyltransferase family 87
VLRHWSGPVPLQRLTWLLVGLMLIGSLVGIVTPAGPGWDFGNFYDTGRRAAAGEIANLYDPDTLIAGEKPQGVMRFWGPPISAYLFVPMSWFSPMTALILFKIENVLVLAATFLILFRLYSRFVPGDDESRSRFAAIFAFLCLIFQPFWTVFRVGGQTTPTVVLLLTVALVFYAKAQFWESALCVCFAAILKPALAPLLAFLVCVSGMPFFLSAAGILVGAGLLSLVLLGWPIHLAFLNRVLKDSQQTFEWYSNSSLYVLLYNLRDVVGPASTTGSYRLLFLALGIGLKALALGTVVYLTLRSRRLVASTQARRHFAFLMAITFFLLWSSTLWEHYLAVLFLLLAYIVAASRYFSREALIIVGLIFLSAIGQNLILTLFLRDTFHFDSVTAHLGIALYKTAPLLLTVLLLWRHHDELFASYSHAAWTRPLHLTSTKVR